MAYALYYDLFEPDLNIMTSCEVQILVLNIMVDIISGKKVLPLWIGT